MVVFNLYSESNAEIKYEYYPEGKKNMNRELSL